MSSVAMVAQLAGEAAPNDPREIELHMRQWLALLRGDAGVQVSREEVVCYIEMLWHNADYAIRWANRSLDSVKAADDKLIAELKRRLDAANERIAELEGRGRLRH